MVFPQDFADLLAAFAAFEVRYLVIGGYAVSIHDRPRTTKDLDVLIDSGVENRQRTCSALAQFGAPRSVLDDLMTASPEDIVWWGNPPLRIDFLQNAPGVDFASAYERRHVLSLDGVDVHVMSLEDLISAKRAAGRPQDIVDADRLAKKLAKAPRG